MYDTIIKIICEGEKIRFSDLLGENRKSEIVFTRQLIMYFARQMRIGSLTFIGEKFGKDHATVLHSIKTIENYIEVDKEKGNLIKCYSDKINRVQRLYDLREEMNKLIVPLKQEVTLLEQRLINVNLVLADMLKQIEPL